MRLCSAFVMYFQEKNYGYSSGRGWGSSKLTYPSISLVVDGIVKIWCKMKYSSVQISKVIRKLSRTSARELIGSSIWLGRSQLAQDYNDKWGDQFWHLRSGIWSVLFSNNGRHYTAYAHFNGAPLRNYLEKPFSIRVAKISNLKITASLADLLCRLTIHSRLYEHMCDRLKTIPGV